MQFPDCKLFTLPINRLEAGVPTLFKFASNPCPFLLPLCPRQCYATRLVASVRASKSCTVATKPLHCRGSVAEKVSLIPEEIMMNNDPSHGHTVGGQARAASESLPLAVRAWGDAC